MKIGIESGAYLRDLRFSQPETWDAPLKRMKAHGYECCDLNLAETEREPYMFSDSELTRTLTGIRNRFEEAGIEISQTHGPWRWPPMDATVEQRQERFEKMARCLRMTAVLGCDSMVIHPIMPFGDNDNPDPDRFMDLNREFFRRLTKIAEEENVIICFENMPMPVLTLARPGEILAFAKEMNSPCFKVCLDTGHSIICGVDPADAVRETGPDYLKVLHVHDNDGKRDLHMLPYTGVIHWSAFTSALEEIGFNGSLSLETSADKNIPLDLREPFEIGVFNMTRRLAGRG